MACNSLCLWMRAFELNVSLLIRKRRLGDNDICWLWKEQTSNQHTLTRQGLCFLAVLHFDFSLKPWTCNAIWKRVRGQSPAIGNTRCFGKESGCWLLLDLNSAHAREWRSWPKTRWQEPRRTSWETLLVHALLDLD